MKNFIKNKKGNKILLGLATASVLTVPAIVAVSCADPVKGTIKNVNYDVDTDKKEIKLTVTGENLTEKKEDWKITYQSKAQLKADEIKEIKKFDIAKVEENKKYTLSFNYGDENSDLNQNGVIYTVSHRGGKGVSTSEVYVTLEISEVKATVSADNKTVTLTVTGGMLSATKEKWTVLKVEPKSKDGETEVVTQVDSNNIEIKEDVSKTRYTLTIKDQDLKKDGITYKVKYDSSNEAVSNPIELNPKIEKVEIDLNSVKNVKLTVTGTKLNIEDSSAYTVKRIEAGNVGGRKEETKDNIIENVEIDKSSTSEKVTLKFHDKELTLGKRYKYSVQIGESKVETEEKDFDKEAKITDIDTTGLKVGGNGEITLTVNGKDLPSDKDYSYKVNVFKVIMDGNNEIESIVSDVNQESISVDGTNKAVIRLKHSNALVANDVYKYYVVIDGVELASTKVTVKAAD